MPLDPNIIMSAKPLDVTGSIMNTLKLRDLSLDSKLKNQQINDQLAVKGAYANNLQKDDQGNVSLNRQGFLSDLAKSAPSQVIPQQQQFTQMDSDVLKHKMDLANMKLDFAGKTVAGVKDQDSYNGWLGKMKAAGFDTSSYPQEYQPGLEDTIQQHAMDAKDQLDQVQKAQGLKIQQQEANAKTTQASADMIKAKAMTGVTPKMTDAYSKEFYTQNKGDLDSLSKYDNAMQTVADSKGSPVGNNLAQMDFVKAAVGRANWQEISMADYNQSAKEKLARAVGIQLTNRDTSDNTAFWTHLLQGAKTQALNRVATAADGFAQAKNTMNANVNPQTLSSALKQQHLSKFGYGGLNGASGGQQDYPLGTTGKAKDGTPVVYKGNGVWQPQ